MPVKQLVSDAILYIKYASDVILPTMQIYWYNANAINA